MTEETYPSWGKTPRLSTLTMTITEKLDGTNGLIQISDTGEIQAGSRTRWLTPDKDNFGFASWVAVNWDYLLELGPGKHYGEWYGRGIQRGYGLEDRRFALFNPFWPEKIPSCVERAPILYQGEADLLQIEWAMALMKREGSIAVPGYMNPEGVIIWVGRQRYKKTYD